MGDFDGMVALVTGGASGIGAATAELLAERGARVAVLDLDPDAADARHLRLACDVGDRASVEAAVGRVAADLGGLDVVVNNAGIGAQGDVAANDDDEWRRVLDVNVVGIVRVSRAALPHLRRSERAAVVNTCSVVATLGLPNRALYAASKGAVLALTLAMAADHLHDGIRVNCVTPGTAETPWIGRLLADTGDPEAALAALRARQPLGRLVTATEVAAAIAYLASPQAGATTGTSLVVDGGLAGLRLPGGARDG
jgi:2-keto-3-deoxy-L-fuconate dehydrogenase